MTCKINKQIRARAHTHTHIYIYIRLLNIGDRIYVDRRPWFYGHRRETDSQQAALIVSTLA